MEPGFRLWTWLAIKKKEIDNYRIGPGSMEAERLFRAHRKAANKLYKAGDLAGAKAELEIGLDHYKGG